MSSPCTPQSWNYSETFVAEDAALAMARHRGTEVGAVPVGSGVGAMLRFLAATVSARAVVEIGTGCGTSGIWIYRGMQPNGTLTTVDVEAEHQRLARQAYTQAGIPTQRTRIITGRAAEVLPRLTDGGYDLVFCDGDKREYPDYYTEALRLLRPGGVVALDNALWHDRVADPSQQDPETVAIRELGKRVADDDRIVPVLLPIGDGLLCARKQD